MPDPNDRAETDVMQFGDDWPGIFIRGDRAKFFEVALTLVIAQLTRLLGDSDQSIEERVMLSAVVGLRDMLRTADKFARENERQYIQYLRPFPECWVGAQKAWQAKPPSTT
jgi:hypothetical protein